MRALLTVTMIAALAAPALAQTGPPRTVSDSVRNQWNTVKNYMSESADQMSEENYNFRPTPEVRSFGEILAHVAGANYLFCSASKGEKSEYGEDSFEKKITSKADIVKALHGSIAYCDAVYAALTDETMAQPAPNATRPVPRAANLISNIGHNNEHYGNLVTYFRLKGMVPPSSK